MSMPTEEEVKSARRVLAAAGYVALKEKSYRQAQERQRVAQIMAADARERERSSDAWWRTEILPQLHHYRERCTFLYGEARAAGVTEEQLRGPK